MITLKDSQSNPETGMDNKTLVVIAIDDTDSKNGMCTTYIAYLLVEQFLRKGVSFEDYPTLIRLNPNIPWKTRGNGAVSLKFRTEDPEKAYEDACMLVSKYSELGNQANPGVVMSTINPPNIEITNFAETALSEVVSRREAISLMKRHNIQYRGWGKQRGLIGALAAIGNLLHNDATFELLAFRSKENWGHQRAVDNESVKKMSRKVYPDTFNCYDEEKKRVLITPRGPDPVLLGVRGEYPEKVLQAYKMIKIDEAVKGYLIFKTNQGTGAHLKSKLDLSDLKAYRTGHFECTVIDPPKTGIGGHVYLKVKNEEGYADCAAYEPTGRFRKSVLSLIPGDLVEIAGSVRRRTSKHPATINMESLLIKKIVDDISLINPDCNICGKRMSSKGQSQGFYCEFCNKIDRKAEKVKFKNPRTIQVGIYIPPPRAQRHLTKPKQRYLLQHKTYSSLIEHWFN